MGDSGEEALAQSLPKQPPGRHNKMKPLSKSASGGLNMHDEAKHKAQTA
jgi:hypothetical protein